MKLFSELDVSVTLTGAEWTAVLARLLRQALSPEGERVFETASKKMQGQLLEACKVAPQETQS